MAVKLAFENHFFEFQGILISKIDVNLNYWIMTKNHIVDPEIGFLTKSILKPYGHTAAMPVVWE